MYQILPWQYVIVINRHRGLYRLYKREARGRYAPEGRALIQPIQTVAPVTKYFLDRAPIAGHCIYPAVLYDILALPEELYEDLALPEEPMPSLSHTQV